MTTYARMTVFFEEPFWVGVYEREEDGRCTACKLTFGAEPKDYEVYDRLLQSWRALRFSPPVPGRLAEEGRISPKRLQRAIRRELQSAGVGTKAQQALALGREAGKLARKRKTRAEREAEEDRRFALRQAKRREKHRGK